MNQLPTRTKFFGKDHGWQLVDLFCLLCAVTISIVSAGAQTQTQETLAEEKRAELKHKLEVFSKWLHSEEGLAYAAFLGNKPNVPYKERYLAELSPGGKIYFLTCRKDYSEALKLLDKFPKRDSGSGLYVRAKCLDGLHRRLDAIAMYAKAKAKIGKDFDPGFRFYLHYSTAQVAAGQDVEAMKNLKIATLKSDDADKYAATKMAVVRSILNRLYYLEERKGKYKEAFNHYLNLFGDAKSQFHLDDPITVDSEIKARAGKWLKEHQTSPAGSDPLALCKYLTTAAKAQIACGNEAKAKESLREAVELRELSVKDLPDELSDDSFSALAKARNTASALLIELDIKDKDYKSACKHIRATFVTDPAKDDLRLFTCLSMHDLSQLVTERDRELHSIVAEERLDFGVPYMRFDGTKGKQAGRRPKAMASPHHN